MAIPASTPEVAGRGGLALPVFLALAVLGLDIVTKQVVQQFIAPGQVIPVTGYFNLVLTFNTGAAFSLFADAAGWQRGFFIAVALAASAFIIYLLHRHRGEALFSIALALILGGAVGNLVDRVLLGHVVDFLDFHLAGYHWPAFNVADSAITCGAILLVYDGFRGSRKPDGR